MRIRARDGDPEAKADMALYEKNGKLINKLRDQKSRLQRLESDLTRNNNREISTWDTSETPSEKPRLGDRYFAQVLKGSEIHYITDGSSTFMKTSACVQYHLSTMAAVGLSQAEDRSRTPSKNYLTKNRLKFLNSEE